MMQLEVCRQRLTRVLMRDLELQGGQKGSCN